MRTRLLSSIAGSGKASRFALIASLVLHIPLAVILLPPMNRQALATAAQQNHVMEVQLRFEKAEATPDPELAPSMISSPLEELEAEKISDVRIENPPDSMPLPDDVPILPLRELPYIPAGELDVRPAPETPVIIPFPDVPLQARKVTGILVLYIGADGTVDRIEADESDLPPLFEKAAIETFLQVRMQPGIKDGIATRARMKVLVEFEAR